MPRYATVAYFGLGSFFPWNVLLTLGTRLGEVFVMMSLREAWDGVLFDC
jgi:hypothetical protein